MIAVIASLVANAVVEDMVTVLVETVVSRTVWVPLLVSSPVTHDGLVTNDFPPNFSGSNLSTESNLELRVGWSSRAKAT